MKKLKVGKSAISGKGIFLQENVRKGERITHIAGEKVRLQIKNKTQAQSIPTWYGVGKTVWIDPGSSIFRFLNHSCNPNAAIIGMRTIIARRAIREGEELTIDYSMTDADELWSMQCRCKEKSCRKTIRSIQFLPSKTVRGHYPFIPKYFLNLYKRVHPSVTIK